MQQFFRQVIDHDRATLEGEWQSLSPGSPIDRVIGVRVGGELRYIRFVAGRSGVGIAARIAGFIQDVTATQAGAES